MYHTSGDCTDGTADYHRAYGVRQEPVHPEVQKGRDQDGKAKFIPEIRRGNERTIRTGNLLAAKRDVVTKHPCDYRHIGRDYQEIIQV